MSVLGCIVLFSCIVSENDVLISKAMVVWSLEGKRTRVGSRFAFKRKLLTFLDRDKLIIAFLMYMADEFAEVVFTPDFYAHCSFCAVFNWQ